jgi:uncharacterized iron-regulated protein
MIRLLQRFALLAGVGVLLFGCGASRLSPGEEGHAFAGRVWDVGAEREISREALFGRASTSRLVILGEVHDNPEHHRVQARILAAMLQAGRSPALVMEQFDHEHQSALDAVRRRGERDPERIADAGRFDRKGWSWPDYRPLLDLAIANDLPIIAANMSREEARAVARAGRPAEGLGPATPELRAALERDLVEGHCGVRPGPAVLAGLIEAQRARDARMAAALERSGERGAVLIAGAGHARRDRGAPVYLSGAARGRLLAVAFVEIEPGRNELRAYAGEDLAASYDLVQFTQRAGREDPCKNLPEFRSR